MQGGFEHPAVHGLKITKFGRKVLERKRLWGRGGVVLWI
jgi:hypothetical protein